MLSEALEKMPHSGSMQLIEEILSATDDEIHCRATDHRGADYPLRIDRELHTSALIELGAQAAAVHTSLHGIGAAHTGLVVALGNVEFFRDTVSDTAPLEVRARLRQSVGDAANYGFEVADSLGTLISGEVLLRMQRNDG
jgi:predicted hotdog family 3-hydroxylacyl-ACP dehydratase